LAWLATEDLPAFKAVVEKAKAALAQNRGN
jgi:hypothetical protein